MQFFGYRGVYLSNEENDMSKMSLDPLLLLTWVHREPALLPDDAFPRLTIEE